MDRTKEKVLIQSLLPGGDNEQVERIISLTNRYLNRSDFLRVAVRKLIEEEQERAKMKDL